MYNIVYPHTYRVEGNVRYHWICCVMFVFEPLNGSYMGTNDSLITKEIEREREGKRE